MARTLSNWTQIVGGSGSITVSGRRANIVDSSGAGGSVAYFRRSIKANPGNVVTARVLAEWVSGSPAIIIDYPSITVQVARTVMNRVGLQEYNCSWIVPATGAVPSDVIVNIGMGTPEIGEVNIFDPIIEVDGIEVDAVFLIEDGEGPNGRFTKFSDGTMICTKQVTVVDCTTAWGSIFTSSVVGVTPFAQSFVGEYRLSYACRGTSPGGATAGIVSTGTSVGVMRGTSASGNFLVDVTAIGRWR